MAIKLTTEQSCTMAYLDEMAFNNEQVIIGRGWTNTRTLKSLAKKGLIKSYDNPQLTDAGQKLIIDLWHGFVNEHPEKYK